eukprot:PhF_6_TR546/c0_g1_i2/m.496
MYVLCVFIILNLAQGNRIRYPSNGFELCQEVRSVSRGENVVFMLNTTMTIDEECGVTLESNRTITLSCLNKSVAIVSPDANTTFFRFIFGDGLESSSVFITMGCTTIGPYLYAEKASLSVVFDDVDMRGHGADIKGKPPLLYVVGVEQDIFATMTNVMSFYVILRNVTLSSHVSISATTGSVAVFSKFPNMAVTFENVVVTNVTSAGTGVGSPVMLGDPGRDERPPIFVTFRNVTFRNTRSARNAGALSMYGAVGSLDSMQVTNSYATINGGGFAFYYDCNLTLQNVDFENCGTGYVANKAGDDTKGGAIDVSYSYLSIVNMTARNTFSMSGGVLYANAMKLLYVDGFTAYNVVGKKLGGAIALYSKTKAVISNVYIENTDGGALDIQADGTVSLRNIVVVNTTGDKGTVLRSENSHTDVTNLTARIFTKTPIFMVEWGELNLTNVTLLGSTYKEYFIEIHNHVGFRAQSLNITAVPPGGGAALLCNTDKDCIVRDLSMAGPFTSLHGGGSYFAMEGTGEFEVTCAKQQQIQQQRPALSGLSGDASGCVSVQKGPPKRVLVQGCDISNCNICDVKPNTTTTVTAVMVQRAATINTTTTIDPTVITIQHQNGSAIVVNASSNPTLVDCEIILRNARKRPIRSSTKQGRNIGLTLVRAAVEGAAVLTTPEVAIATQSLS